MISESKEKLTLEEKVFQSLGAASVCWENIKGAGIFESSRAEEIGNDLVKFIKEEYKERVHIKVHGEQGDENAFKEAAIPMIKYLCENHHPHVSVIITPTNAELLEGLKSTGNVYDYLRD